jgi:hypothetical protein
MIAKAASGTQAQGNSTDSGGGKCHQGGCAQNAITLTIQGVNFCLIPSDNPNDQCDASNINSNENDESSACASSAFLSFTNGQSTSIRLQSFTGTLMIYKSEEQNPTRALNDKPITAASVPDTQNDDKANVVSARKVEDEPTTPNSYSNGNVSPLEQGQQQLSFKRVSDNKRVSVLSQ